MLAEKIPLHFGVHPGWVEIIWNSPNSITITPNAQHPRLNRQERQELLERCEGLVPTATDRRTFTYKDLYLGHRASRAHGLTASTLVHQNTVRELNQRLRLLLPGATWTTIGLLQHRSVPTHQDMLSEEWSYAITLVNNGAIFRYTSPLTGLTQHLDLNRSLAVFDPTLPHGVTTRGLARTLTLYSTKRAPTPRNRISLQELGFPVGDTTAPTPPRQLLTPTPDPHRRQLRLAQHRQRTPERQSPPQLT